MPQIWGMETLKHTRTVVISTGTDQGFFTKFLEKITATYSPFAQVLVGMK